MTTAIIFDILSYVFDRCTLAETPRVPGRERPGGGPLVTQLRAQLPH